MLDENALKSPRDWVSNGGAPLTLRVRLVIVMLLTAAVVAVTFQLVASTALNRLHEAQSADARAHFTGRTASIDQEWRGDSTATRQLIERWLSTVEAKREVRHATLHSLLTTILAQDDFSHVVIINAKRGVVFRHGSTGRDHPGIPAESTESGLGWVYSEVDQMVYRTVSGPITFEEEASQLILYAPIDNGLLRRLVYPSTVLTVKHGMHVIAQTRDVSSSPAPTTLMRSLRQTGLEVKWDDSPAAPVLVIHRQFASPLPEWQLLLGMTTCAALFILSGWVVVGRWTSSQAARLHTLQRAASAFASESSVDALDAARMARIANHRDDIGILAFKLRQMMDRIVLGQSEQHHAQQALASLNANLEARVAQRTQELEQARDLALAAVKSKQTFLSNMSHEIRTPMNGMLGALELLSLTPLTAQQNQFIEVATVSGEALLDIINQVLDYAKIDAGQLNLAREPVDVNAIARSVVTLFSASAERKSIALRLDEDPALAGARLGDALRLRQVLMNLVGNALKFTYHGEICVSTRLVGVSGHERVALRVSDTGIGIAPDQQPRIFDAFVQAETSAQRHSGGTGLGLAISRELVRAMGGELTVVSTLGQGSTFEFQLLLEAAEDAMPAARPPPEQPKAQRPLVGRVLLVEDSSVNRLVGSAMLNLLGLDVLLAEDGEQALAVLAEHDVALVLMDCQMPVIDGYEATQRLRDRERLGRLRRTPVIALTAYALSGDVERCMAAGMDGYLAKPYTTEKLRTVLAPWLDGQAGSGGASQAR